MAIPLLTTKLYIPPIRPEIISRPRLIECLDAGFYRKLTLVSAPAGFGKTTLVNAWLRSTDRKVIWVSLDEGDNDLIRFLNYLITAFQQLDNEIAQALEHLTITPQLPDVDELLTELINTITSVSNPFVLVFDDYQVITERRVHEVVSWLLERQPPQMHMTLITRQDPPVQLSRLRGRDQVTEVRQRDLRFTNEETAAFLNMAMGMTLSAYEITALRTQTEGWVAGLQMAAVVLQAYITESGTESIPRFIQNFSSRNRFILDYLADEVLMGQPEQVRFFLLRTSILERMCGSLCDNLVDIPRGGRLPLPRVERFLIICNAPTYL